MFRSNKINLASANDIIDSLLESSEIMSGTGAVIITQKNGRKTTNTGAIYLRDGLIYAADIVNHDVPIGKRIETGALVRPEDLKEVFSKVGGDTTSPRIVDHLLQNHMIGEKILSSYVKEHFIETLGKIMSWNDSLGEWHPNSVTKDFVMPFVTFERIRQILAQRKHVYGEFLRLTEKFMRPEELPELTFALLKAPAAGQSPTTLKIISLCDSKHTIDDITNATGVTFYNVFQTILGLWRDGLLALNIGGIRLPYTSVLAEPEPAPVPLVIELINPPIPVHEEVDENSEAPDVEPVAPEEDSATETEQDEPQESPVDERLLGVNTQGEEVVQTKDENATNTFIVGEVGTGKTTSLFANKHDYILRDEEATIVNDPDYLASLVGEYAGERSISYQHFTQDPAETEPVLYNPLQDADESSEVDPDSTSTETTPVLPKEILGRRNKVEQINNKLNQLESNLANCEKELQENQITVGALEERKTSLENELGEVAEDYRRAIAEADNIRKSYESIRKEVEDTINSFTFIEGE